MRSNDVTQNMGPPWRSARLSRAKPGLSFPGRSWTKSEGRFQGSDLEGGPPYDCDGSDSSTEKLAGTNGVMCECDAHLNPLCPLELSLI